MAVAKVEALEGVLGSAIRGLRRYPALAEASVVMCAGAFAAGRTPPKAALTF